MNSLRLPGPLLAAALCAAALGATPLARAATAELTFDGERYLSAGVERDATRNAEHFIRVDESLIRFSRRFTVADHPEATSVKQLGLGVLRIARLRTPGIEPESFAADGAEDRDLTVTWFDLTDDGVAVEFHVVRFVARPDKTGATRGVREYHFVAREFTNGRPPDDTLAGFTPVVAAFAEHWVQEIQRFDRAPGPGPVPKGK